MLIPRTHRDDLDEAGDVDLPRLNVSQDLLLELSRTCVSAELRKMKPSLRRTGIIGFIRHKGKRKGDTNIENSKYKYGREEAVTDSVGPVVEVLPHGSKCSNLVRIEDKLNGVQVQSRSKNMSGEVDEDITHGRIGSKRSPI